MFNIEIQSENVDPAFQELLENLLGFAQQRLELPSGCNIVVVQDTENYQNPLGKTAYYDPTDRKIVCYSDGRHTKDMLRSISHELVHHKQNCRGDFDKTVEMGEGYAQNDKHLRKMEEEAYLNGNMIFRDWEDQHKTQNDYIKKYVKQKNKSLNEALMKQLFKK